MHNQRDYSLLERGAGLIEYIPVTVIVSILIIALVIALSGQLVLGLSIFFGVIVLIGSWIGGWLLYYRWQERKKARNSDHLEPR